MTARPLARKLFTFLLGAALAAGCGNSLSSLEGVESSVREVFDMHLMPDYGPRGKTVKVTVTEMDDELVLLIGESEIYPVEISFGEGTHVKTFGTNDHDQFQVEIAISALAGKGKREPFLVFWIDDLQKEVEVRGSFWISGE